MAKKPEQTKEPDRRVNPRKPIVVKEARCISGIDVFFGYAANVSRGGLFIATPKLRRRDEEYEIQFTLPGLDRTFHCRARVMWTRHYRHDSPESPGFGLQFIDLPQADADLIDQWISSNDRG